MEMSTYNYEEAYSANEDAIASLPSKQIYNKAYAIYVDFLKDDSLSIEEACKIADLLRLFFNLDFGL